MSDLADEVLGITDAKNRLSQIVARLQEGTQERVVILRNNVAVAVIVSVGVYDDFRKSAKERDRAVERLERAGIL